MTAKELCTHFFDQAGTGWKDVPFQMKIAKELTQRYQDQDLLYALEYYKDKMYSLGFLSPKNMAVAIEKRKSTAQIQYEVGEENIAERNRTKLQNASSQSREREGYYFDMLKE